MKTHKLAILVAIFATFLLTSGRAGILDIMYGNSGVFVTNQYEDLILEVKTNNNLFAAVPLGQPIRFPTYGLVNRDEMLLIAVFKDKDGRIVGTDSQTVRVNYRRGAPFVKAWTPKIQEVKRFAAAKRKN